MQFTPAGSLRLAIAFDLLFCKQRLHFSTRSEHTSPFEKLVQLDFLGIDIDILNYHVDNLLSLMCSSYWRYDIRVVLVIIFANSCW